MKRYLIINADDFGMCRSANLAVYDLFEKGGITSATIMAPCPWAKEAAVWAAAHPEYAVGLHLTTTAEWGNYRWTPVAENVPSLKDEEGFMWHESDQFEEHADLEDVRKEINAQYDRLAQYGFTPSHFDNHMGSLYGVATGRFELLGVTIEECAKHGQMPFRFPSKFTDEQFGNKMLDINVPKEAVEALIEPMVQGANAAGVAILDYLMPGDWNGPRVKATRISENTSLKSTAPSPRVLLKPTFTPLLKVKKSRESAAHGREETGNTSSSLTPKPLTS